MFSDPPANEEEEDKFIGLTAADIYYGEDKLWLIMDTDQDLRFYLYQCTNLENETTVFKEETDANVIAQITEEEDVIEDQDEFQQITLAAEVASQLISAMRLLETQAID